MKARSWLTLCSALSAAAVVLAVAALFDSQPAPTAQASPTVSGARATGGGHILKSAAGAGVHFGFNAQVQNNGRLHGSGVVQDHDADIRIKILTVESFVSDGTNATFTGQCEFEGFPQQYEIKVSDINEPGRGFDNFQITTGTYTRAGTLTGGNIQVRGVAAVTPTPTPTATPTPTPPPDIAPPRGKKPKPRGGD